jgi:hypothetical protein
MHTSSDLLSAYGRMTSKVRGDEDSLGGSNVYAVFVMCWNGGGGGS